MPIIRDKARRDVMRHELYQKLAAGGVGVAETVRTLRQILEKDQSAFAAMIGISLATLRKIEQERGNVTVASLGKILGRFGLELAVRSKPRAPSQTGASP